MAPGNIHLTSLSIEPQSRGRICKLIHAKFPSVIFKKLLIITFYSGFPCTGLHSQLSQNDRLSSLAKFKCGVIKLLVATDVASR